MLQKCVFLNMIYHFLFQYLALVYDGKIYGSLYHCRYFLLQEYEQAITGWAQERVVMPLCQMVLFVSTGSYSVLISN